MSILQTTGKWITRALALKLGRGVIKKGGILGIGAGVILAFGYLSHNFINNRKKRKLGGIGYIDEDKNQEVEGKKRIVV